MPQRVKLSHVAYDRFKERLFQHDMHPGQFFSQREMVQLTGVPLAPMREALQKLESEGLVHIIPQRGIRVTDANLRLLRNTFQLRRIIEQEGVRNFVESAEDTEIDALEAAHLEIVARSRNDVDDNLLEDAQRVDWQMHDTMINGIGNDLISEIHRVNSDRIRLIRLDHGLITRSSLAKTMDEHLAILRACKMRDAAAAMHAAELHISMAMHRAMGV